MPKIIIRTIAIYMKAIKLSWQWYITQCFFRSFNSKRMSPFWFYIPDYLNQPSQSKVERLLKVHIEVSHNDLEESKTRIFTTRGFPTKLSSPQKTRHNVSLNFWFTVQSFPYQGKSGRISSSVFFMTWKKYGFWSLWKKTYFQSVEF